MGVPGDRAGDHAGDRPVSTHRELVRGVSLTRRFGRDRARAGPRGGRVAAGEGIDGADADGNGATRRRRPAVDDVSISIDRVDRVALVGESGSGKSTLARLLLGLTRPTSGRVFFRDRALELQSRDERREFRKVCRFVFQDARSHLNPLFRVRELIAEPLVVYDTMGRTAREGRVREVLSWVNGDVRWLDAYPHELSGGEIRRVALARALAHPPDLLIADEPVAGLDVTLQVEILSVLDLALQATASALLVISHDIAVVSRLASRVHVMHEGRIVETLSTHRGKPSRPQTAYAASLFEAAEAVRVPARKDAPDA